MEIHPPHAIHSVKDFLLQLLTITAGILIALTLEGILDWTHHRQLVHEAEANLRTEMRENQAEINKGMQQLHVSQDQLKDMIRVVQQVEQDRSTQLKGYSFSWTLNELHATSWNTASATGAIAFMDYSEVKRYTRVYDLQQQFMTLQNRAFDSILAVYGLGTLLQKDIKKVSDAQLADAERVLGLALSNAGAVESLETALNEEYTRVLKGVN